MFLLDTVALSDVDKPRPNVGLKGWFETVEVGDLYLSTISIAELWSGIIRLPHGPRRRALEVSFNLIEDRFSDRILPVDHAVAVRYAEIQKERGPLPILDTFIGATALVHRLAVVTRNTGDIARTGAQIVDPWT
jgi:toxin FitB